MSLEEGVIDLGLDFRGGTARLLLVPTEFGGGTVQSRFRTLRGSCHLAGAGTIRTVKKLI